VALGQESCFVERGSPPDTLVALNIACSRRLADPNAIDRRNRFDSQRWLMCGTMLALA
jgi:hypothetical protein